jgi:hypothetical protein
MRALALSVLLSCLLLLGACGGGGSTSPTETAAPATAPPTTEGGPTVTATPFTPIPTYVLAPAESDFPAAGTCNPQPDSDVVTFDLVPGIPSPRCAQVMQDQHLQIENHTGQTVEIMFATSTITITDRQSADLEEAVGTYLAPGVHVAHVDFYGGSGPEVWVQP